jgi:hypothetical protein
MSGLRSQLSPHEEVALRRVALVASEGLEPAHVQRLQHLHLIELDGRWWRLTALGQQRLKALSPAGMSPRARAPDEIARILAKFIKPREHHLPCRFVLPLALVRDLPQQIILRPGQVGHFTTTSGRTSADAALASRGACFCLGVHHWSTLSIFRAGDIREWLANA